MQIVISSWSLSASHLPGSAWPGYHRCSPLKRQGWGLGEGQCQCWNCLLMFFEQWACISI